MSMSMYVQAFRKLDGEFAKMIKVKEFCEEQGVSLPAEVEQYFGQYALDPTDYIREQMAEMELPDDCKVEGDDERINGNFIEIDVAKIPAEVKKIRFVVSF